MQNYQYPMTLDNNGALLMAEGIEYVTLTAQHHLRTVLGEWYENRKLGLPWYTYILGVIPPELNAMRAECTLAILGVPGIAKVESLEITTEGEMAKVIFVASTITGETTNPIEVIL